MREKVSGETKNPMKRQEEERGEGQKQEEGASTPFSPPWPICGLTQTGKQTASLRKPQTVPQRDRPRRGSEGGGPRSDRGSRQTTRVSARRGESCLFGRLRPPPENKRVLGPVFTGFTHVCSKSHYVTATNYFLFSLGQTVGPSRARGGGGGVSSKPSDTSSVDKRTP